MLLQDQQVAELDTILDPTQGFVDTGDQEQFDACEAAVNEVMQKIKRVSQRWKVISPRFLLFQL